MKKRSRQLLALALSCSSFAATAADQLVWSETYQVFTPRFSTVGSIDTATVPGGPSSALVTSQTQVKGPNGVEFVAGRIWWPDQQLNAIGSTQADGSDFRSYGVSGPYDLDVHGNTLYVTRLNSGDIRTIDLTAANPGAVLFKSGLTSPFAIDVTADGVYWSQVTSSNRLMRSNLDGSNVQTLLTDVQTYDFEVAGAYIYLTTTDGFVKRSNLDGSDLTTLASGLGFLNGIDVTDDTIYVSALQGVTTLPSGNQTLGAGRIFSMGLDGSGAVEVIRAQEVFDPNLPFSPSQMRGVAVLAVPEPETTALLLAGLGVIGAAARRRRRA